MKTLTSKQLRQSQIKQNLCSNTFLLIPPLWNDKSLAGAQKSMKQSIKEQQHRHNTETQTPEDGCDYNWNWDQMAIKWEHVTYLQGTSLKHQ